MAEYQHYVNKDKVLDAYKVLKGVVTKTPLQKDDYLSDKYDATILIKREDLQKVRSFKLRGAYYAMSQLSDEQLGQGVVCASAGNHAQGVAYTARKLQTQADIFMPVTTPNQKIQQVEYFGQDYVTIHLIGDTFDACSVAAHRYSENHDQYFVEPFNDYNVIAGQGTLAVEIHQELVAAGETADYFVCQIGGGGLISGVAAYASEAMPETTIIGVEATGAPSMQTSVLNKQVTPLDRIDPFCDGTAVAEVGALTFDITQDLVDYFVVVEEGLVCSKILDMYTRQAIIAEPSGALSIAALDKMKDEIKGKTVICLVSGGNNDINRLSEIEERALMYEGRKHYFILHFPQRAGALREFVSEIIGPKDDITTFQYTKKSNRNEGPLLVGVELADPDSLPSLLERIADFDPNYISLNDNHTLYELLV